MLSVDDCQEELNRPFREGRDRPARCYSRRDAVAAHRLAYRLLRPLKEEAAGDPDDPDDRTDTEATD